MKVLADLLSLPLWEVAVEGEGERESYTLPMIKNYIARYELNSSLSLEQGYLLLDYHWQQHMGDFTFHRENFPQLSLLRHTVSWEKRKLAITINPFVSVESEHFKEGVQRKLFVMERNSTRDKFIPALTWFKVWTEKGRGKVMLISYILSFRMFLWPLCWTSLTRTPWPGSSQN